MNYGCCLLVGLVLSIFFYFSFFLFFYFSITSSTIYYWDHMLIGALTLLQGFVYGGSQQVDLFRDPPSDLNLTPHSTEEEAGVL